MRPLALTRLVLLLLLLPFGLVGSRANAQLAPPNSTEPAYPDSADGLKAQFADILLATRSSDPTSLPAALAALAIPNPDAWFAAHFDPRFRPQISQDYAKSLTAYQSHIAWVMANFAKFDDFSIKVQPSEMPPPLRDSGFETLLPRPLDTVKVENYRLTSAASDPKHGPPSWVSSFVHIDGRFRYVGGTYPFWAEGLNAWRGPMSIPPSIIHGRSVQGIAFRKDQKGPGIDAIVQLKINVGPSGRVDHIKVLSGEEPFIQDAKDYVKAADFGPLPNVPQLANARREWEFEVAFFTPKL